MRLEGPAEVRRDNWTVSRAYKFIEYMMASLCQAYAAPDPANVVPDEYEKTMYLSGLAFGCWSGVNPSDCGADITEAEMEWLRNYKL